VNKKRAPLKTLMITHEQGDERYDIGCIAIPRKVSVVSAHRIIRSAWEEFQASHPDCDYEFIEWLIQNNGFTTVDSASAAETFEV